MGQKIEHQDLEYFNHLEIVQLEELIQLTKINQIILKINKKMKYLIKYSLVKDRNHTKKVNNE